MIRTLLGRVPITKGGLDPTSRPRVEPTLNRVHITIDNPRSNPLYIECRVEPTYLDVTMLTAYHDFCWSLRPAMKSLWRQLLTYLLTYFRVAVMKVVATAWNLLPIVQYFDSVTCHILEFSPKRIQ